MTAEIRILLYAVFALSLFVLPSLALFAVCGFVLGIMLARIPRKTLLSGWVPITLFLLFTFVSNLLYGHGRILVSAGPLVVTDEGLHAAVLRASRLLLMIMGVKVLMGLTSTEAIISGIGRLLSPLERAGLPVADFVHTMGLTVRCFPALKEMAVDTYRARARENAAKGFWDRAGIAAGFLVPLFVRSMREPEAFFGGKAGSDDKV